MWVTICDNELEQTIDGSISDIAVELLAMEASPLSALRLGEHALLYAYLGLDKPYEDWHDRSLNCLNLAIERLSITPTLHLGLYGGLAGFGWMVQHVVSILSRKEVGVASEESEMDDPLSELDQHILHLFENEDILGQNYDLISGYVGIGIYWLERLPSKNALLGIRLTLNSLHQLSKNTPIGITWFTPPFLVPPIQKEFTHSGYFNLGVAHGVPGVIAFLAQAAALESDEEITKTASTLLVGSIKWLLAQQRPPDFISRYSSWNVPGRDCGDTRLAWCYGDLGIASVLRFVAQCTKNPIWMTEARSLIERCTLWKMNTEVLDAPLCHGAFGNAHLFNRAYQAHHENSYKQAALYWIRKGLTLRKPGVGIAGYYAWRPDAIPCEQTDSSFLTGAVGVALALLSAISPIEPKWDRIMLLSGVQHLSN